MMKRTMKPTIHSSGVLKRGVPVTIVVIQEKSWIAGGDDDDQAGAGEVDRGDRRQADREHVVRPDAEPDQGDEDLGQGDEREGDHPPPHEGGDDRGRDPERGQDDDVDLGVAEDPEQVLPEDRVAAGEDVVEVEAEQAVALEQEEGDGQRRHREDQGEGDGEEGEAEERHPVDRHPRGPVLEDRDDEVDRRRQARDPVEDQGQRVEVDPRAGAEGARGERHVVEPAGVGPVAGEQADVDEDPRAEVDPVGEGVEPREGHVAGADHQRQQVVPEARRSPAG